MLQQKTTIQKPDVLVELDLLLKKATEKRASDIHLKVGLPAIIRVHGQLYYLAEEQDATGIKRVQYSFLMHTIQALLTTKQKQRYDNGEEIDLGYELKDVGRFRINICQQKSLPRLVMRFIPDRIPGFTELYLPNKVETFCTQMRGLVLVTGATGSGKSTTLASIIDNISTNRSCHIITIEDPIEFIFKDKRSMVTQREIGMDTESFSRALKFGLRQDPDVILVGEMRDEETILMALAAAETGHLVFSTLHTIDATETINRILSQVSGPMQSQIRTQLASVLVGVVSQRLLRKKDGTGRIPAIEVFVNNARTKEMILDSTRTSEIHQAIEESYSLGMQSFDQSLVDLLEKQLISEEEALLNARNPKEFEMRLKGIVGKSWGQQSNIEEIEIKEGHSKSIEIELPTPPPVKNIVKKS